MRERLCFILVEEDTTKSINISKEKSKSATYLQPTKELTDQIDLLPYLNYLFCFIEKKKADACSISVGGTSNSPIAILAHTISLLKAAESEKIAFSSLTHTKPLDKCFNGIKFASAKGGYSLITYINSNININTVITTTTTTSLLRLPLLIDLDYISLILNFYIKEIKARSPPCV